MDAANQGSAHDAVVLLGGGFGNQLFQLAAAMNAVASEDLTRITLLTYGNAWGPEHPSLESVLDLPSFYPTRGLRMRYPGVAMRESWRDAVSSKVSKLVSNVTGTHLLRQGSPFDARPKIHARTLVLDGFFQHPSWWERTWRSVATLLEAHRPAAVDDLRREDRTVVKIRRSDYLGRGIALVEGYYEKALDALDIRGCPVTVVCEEREYLTHFQRLLAQRDCVAIAPEVITGNANVDHFWNLAAGTRHVLANSSYCWWAAAVSTAHGSRSEVAYPHPWLPDAWGSHGVPDMGLPTWRRISAHFE